ncbi:hypothetical protein [Paenibacillus illinoisensis]|uniref:hypothetical protein n=1 Tax=Paenibacillus illinoisensis TaxID=59845 RepID=UPI00203B6DE7|nr:hypothetical protein [Paenibacillus illinoisensis]MCM3205653.1 hypothetical protein [Paenibacillus illinoisensis]
MSNATQTYREERQPLVREVQRKANAGERIKIVASDDRRYSNGDEFVVDEIGRAGVFVKHPRGRRNGCAGIFHSEYVVLEPIAPSLPDLFAQFIRDNAPAVRSYLAEIDPDKCAEPTEDVAQSAPAPLTRAKAIEMARERVAELERIGSDRDSELMESAQFSVTFYAIEFLINRNKRAVTALVYPTDSGGSRVYRRPAAVGIAKCAPDDVFNTDLGKAIAAERALGLTLTDAFVDAPKPTEPAKGMTVGFYDTEGEYLRMTVTDVSREKLRGTVDGSKGFVYRNAGSRYGGNCTDPAIIDDTDAIYPQEAGEAA